MAKLLTMVIAALLLAATMANASSFTVTTTVEEMDISRGKGECRQEMQQFSQELRHCKKYLLDKPTGGQQYNYLGRPAIKENQMMPEQFKHFSQCCGALQNIRDQQCVCQSLEKIVSSGSGGRGQEEEQSQQFAMAQASYLPMLCGLGHTCQFQSSYGDV